MISATTAPDAGGVFPICFKNLAKYEAWREMAVLSRTVMKPHAHCQDCTKAYQWRMSLTGRCDNLRANPELAA